MKNPIGFVITVIGALTFLDLLKERWPRHELLWFAVSLVIVSVISYLCVPKLKRPPIARTLGLLVALLAVYDLAIHLLPK